MKMNGMYRKKLLLTGSFLISAAVIHCTILSTYSAFVIPVLCVMSLLNWLFHEELFVFREFNKEWRAKIFSEKNNIADMMTNKKAIIELENDLNTASKIIANAFWNIFFYIALFFASICVFTLRLPNESLFFSYDIGVLMALSLCSTVVYFQIASETSWSKKSMIRILNHRKTDIIV